MPSGYKYTFLRNRGDLSNKQETELAELITLYPKLGEAYRLKELFNDLWAMPGKVAAELFLRQWCLEADAAKIPAFMAFANTVRAHWSGIVQFLESRLTNGILEGICLVPNTTGQAKSQGLPQYQQLHQYDLFPMWKVEI
jgi:transposase